MSFLKRKLKKVNYLKNDIFYMKEVKMEMKFIFGSVTNEKNINFKYISEKKPIDIFFGIGEGRVYVEEGRFNTEDEGKKNF